MMSCKRAIDSMTTYQCRVRVISKFAGSKETFSYSFHMVVDLDEVNEDGRRIQL